MKSKLTNTILFIAVAGIWGYIGYFIYQSVKDNEDEDLVYSLSRSAKQEDSVRSSYPLSLNYTDPFLKGTVASINKPSTEKRSNPPLKKDMEASWPNVKFNGIVEKAHGITLAILNIDNTIHFAAKGQYVSPFSILQISSDSLQLGWQDEKKWIRRE